jgi:hypothetical protein
MEIDGCSLIVHSNAPRPKQWPTTCTASLINSIVTSSIFSDMPRRMC